MKIFSKFIFQFNSYSFRFRHFFHLYQIPLRYKYFNKVCVQHAIRNLTTWKTRLDTNKKDTRKQTLHICHYFYYRASLQRDMR